MTDSVRILFGIAFMIVGCALMYYGATGLWTTGKLIYESFKTKKDK